MTLKTQAVALRKRGYTVEVSHQSDDGPTIYSVTWPYGSLYVSEGDDETVAALLKLDPTVPPVDEGGLS